MVWTWKSSPFRLIFLGREFLIRFSLIGLRLPGSVFLEVPLQLILQRHRVISCFKPGVFKMSCPSFFTTEAITVTSTPRKLCAWPTMELNCFGHLTRSGNPGALQADSSRAIEYGSSCVSGGYSNMHERRAIIPSLEPGFDGWFLTN